MTPSRCQNYHWIYLYNKESEDEQEDLDLGKYGKWLLFFDRLERDELTGLTALDDGWQKLMNIDDFNSTGVSEMKCSTSAPNSSSSDSCVGVICCYTPNYTDKAQVKRAAIAIRKLVDFPRDMFYKTDENTYAEKYWWKGDRYISLYKHTTTNRLYERNSIDHKWYPVYSEEDIARRNSDMSSIISKLNNILRPPPENNSIQKMNLTAGTISKQTTAADGELFESEGADRNTPVPNEEERSLRLEKK